MSLSEAPSAQITFSTPQEISDEILGATIQFCRETGYKPNIMMLTFFWSAFLLTAKNELSKYHLTKSVINYYTFSLRTLFPQLSEDKEMQKEVENLCQRYYNGLSSDFSNLNNEAEIENLIEIANELNFQNKITATYQLKTDPAKTFSRTSSAISSALYRILFRVNNGFTIQHKQILDEFNHSPSQSSYVTPQKTSPIIQPRTNAHMQTKTTGISSRSKIILIVLALLIGIIIIANLGDDSNSDLEPVAEPRSGTILTGSEDFYGSTLTITASSGKSCVVKLKTSTGNTRLSFYVRAGDTVTVGVPEEYLYVYFATGETWYGEYYLFGENTNYSMDNELLDFAQNSWEYTLYPVSNGNFSQTPIDAEKFG